MKIDQSISEVSKNLLATFDLSNSHHSNSYPGKIPDIDKCIKATKCILSTLAPGRFTDYSDKSELFENQLKEGIYLLKQEIENLDLSNNSTAEELISSFLSNLVPIRENLIHDIEAAYKGDPAAYSYTEVILSYPSILAVGVHRISHLLFSLNVPFIPRIISEWAHSKTGIDIHPGARIQQGFFIDHGTGVVIGETCQIGKNVKIYQGVTLGARSFSVDEYGNLIKGEKRHPTVEDSVVVYANTTILGGETIIGKDSVIGGNIFLMESVPAGSIVISKATSNPSAKNFEIISKNK